MDDSLRACPICKVSPALRYVGSSFSVFCSESCAAPNCEHTTKHDTTISWNDWAEWYASQTGILRRHLETYYGKPIEEIGCIDSKDPS